MPDLTSFNPYAAGAQAVGGLVTSITGLLQRGQANKWLKRNPQVIEGIQREYLQNQGIANNMANTGLPSQVYNNAMKRIQKQQLTALSYANDRRGGLTALPGITSATNDAMADLEAKDAEARIGNQRYAIDVNNQVAGVKRDLYEKNIRRPYERKRDEMMNQLAAGNQNLTGGIDRLTSSGLSYLGAGIGGGTSADPSGDSGGITADWLRRNQWNTGRRF